MAVEPVNLGYALLYSTLHNDATFAAQVVGIFQGAAPAGTATGNVCILNLQSSTDTNSAFGARILTRQLFQVKIVGPLNVLQGDNSSAIRSAYARADALLQPSGLPTRNSGGTLACFREQAISYTELRGDGTLWLHYGGLYRVEV
jgi:hypothetical protein